MFSFAAAFSHFWLQLFADEFGYEEDEREPENAEPVDDRDDDEEDEDGMDFDFCCIWVIVLGKCNVIFHIYRKGCGWVLAGQMVG